MTEKVTELPPKQPNAPTVACAIVPMDIMQDVTDVLREAPFKSAKPVLEKLATVPVQQVEVKAPND